MKKSLITLFCGGLLLAACSGESVESLTQKGNAALEGGNAAEAVELFTKAAEKNGAEAARQLGSLYAKGEGVDKSLEEASKFYMQATELGDSVAPCLLAGMYAEGEGVEANPAKALELYEKSGKLGHLPALVALDDIYFRGRDGFELDWGKAYTNAVNAAALGDADAMAIEGYFDCMGQYGAEKNVDKGLKLLQESVDKGSVLGKALLGYCQLYTDRGVRAESIKLIDEAAAAGEPFGVMYQGYCHESGYKSASFGKARKFYKQAAEMGCPHALMRLAVACDLQLDKKESHEWYAKAAERGEGEALSRMGYYYLNGFSVEKSPEKAMEYFKKGADKGNPTAMANVGYCYEEGEGVAVDKAKAKEWYEKAIKYGDPYFSQGQLKNL